MHHGDEHKWHRGQRGGQFADVHNQIQFGRPAGVHTPICQKNPKVCSRTMSTEHLVFDRKISQKHCQPSFGVLVLRYGLLLPWS